MIVAHANSLRALIGTLCRVTDDQRPGALRKLEALQLPTGVPLVLFYQETDTAGHYRVCDIMPTTQQQQQEQPQEFASSTTTTDLPVWPLRSLPSLDYSYYYAKATSSTSTATTKAINPLTAPAVAPTRKPKVGEHYDVYLLVPVVFRNERQRTCKSITNNLFLVSAFVFFPR